MADWSKIIKRGNVEDRRGLKPAIVGGISLTGIAILFVLNAVSGGTTEQFLYQVADMVVGQIEQGQLMSTPDQVQNADEFQGDDSYEMFASAVLGSNNEHWQQVFETNSKKYIEPKLVLFRVATSSGCGTATSEVGPHYCPADQTIYLDETFFDELQNRFGAMGGDVAEAYVIGHEVAHHVQNQLGIVEKVHQKPSNEASINLELQADCFAGMWANSIKDLDILEPGEIREAMDAAASVGDDRIQEKVTGQVNPESWTHGSSDQRVAWFEKGYEHGSLEMCDTF